jgi:hypothetical protein
VVVLGAAAGLGAGGDVLVDWAGFAGGFGAAGLVAVPVGAVGAVFWVALAAGFVAGLVAVGAVPFVTGLVAVV